MRGRFISFEGGDGTGKSTQADRLEARLRKKGIDLLRTREPGGTDVGEQIRYLLQHAEEAADLCSESELLLFAASRAQLVREVIAPSLAFGKWVLADRFLDSTTVYQGVARGLPLETVRRINDFAVGDCRPDITFLLDIDPDIARSRIDQQERGRDRMESQDDGFYAMVRQGYLDLANAESERIVTFDASIDPDTLEEMIWKNLKQNNNHGLPC